MTNEDIDRIDALIKEFIVDKFYIGLTEFRDEIGGWIASGRAGAFKSIPANDLFTVLDQRLAMAAAFKDIQQIALEKDYGDGIKKKIFIVMPLSVTVDPINVKNLLT